MKRGIHRWIGSSSLWQDALGSAVLIENASIECSITRKHIRQHPFCLEASVLRA